MHAFSRSIAAGLLLALPGMLVAQGDLRKELDDHFLKGAAFREKGKWAEALPHFEKAAELANAVFGPEDRNTASIVNGLAFNYSQLGRRPEAERAYRIALAIREKRIKEFPLEVAATLENLAFDCAQLGKFNEAEAFYRRCGEIEDAAKGPNRAPDLLRMNNVASLYYKMGRYPDAEALYRKCLKAQEETLGKEHAALGHTLNNLANICRVIGNFTEAEGHVRRALQILEKNLGKDHPQSTFSYAMLADIYQQSGRNDEAEAILRRNVAIREAAFGKDHPLVAQSLTTLAQMLMGKQSGAEPESLLRRSLAILEKALGPDHADLSVPLLSLANWKRNLGQTDEAEPLIRRAVAILEKQLGKDHPRLIPFYQALGHVHSRKRQYDDALIDFRRGLEICERTQGPDHPEVASFLNDLALTASALNRPADAEQYYLRGLELVTKRLPPWHPSITAAEHNLALFYYRERRFEKAEVLLQSGLKRAEASSDKNNGAARRILNNLSAVNMALGRPQIAVPMQQRVLEIDEQSLRNVFGFSSEQAMFSYLGTRSGLLPNLISMALATDTTGPTAEIACDWTLRLQGIVFDSVCRFRQAQQMTTNPEFQKQLLHYHTLKQRLADAALNPPPNLKPEQVREQLADWRKQVEQLEGQLNDAMSAQQRNLLSDSAISTADVRSKLQPGSALVLFVNMPPRNFKTSDWTAHRYLAFVITPGVKPPQLFELGLTKDIDADVEAIRKEFDDFQEKLKDCDSDEESWALEKSQEKVFRAKSRLLHAKLIAPLRQALGSLELLYLVPDGGLNRLPFEALVDDKGAYLAETLRCTYLSSGRDLLRPAEKLAQGVAVFAGPDFKASSADRNVLAAKLLGKSEQVASRGAGNLNLRSAGWKPLPGAAAEADDIRQLLKESAFGPVKTFTGAAAMEEVLKAMPPPRILHLATHGFFLDHQKDAEDSEEGGAGAGWARGKLKKLDNPLLRSGIVLAGANTIGDKDNGGSPEDGWVTAEEIALLDLHGTELVVLSACQTGLGDVKGGEGVYGLRRAFLVAGARSLLSSLFEVPDTETRELMKHFYKGLKNGQPKSIALNSAQRTLIASRRQGHGAAHPFFWASFVLTGDAR